MKNNVLDYIEITCRRVPDKIAFANEGSALTFAEFRDKARRVASFLCSKKVYKSPVLVFMSKTPDFLAAVFGVVYGGNYYVPIDSEMPRQRIDLIIKNTNADYMICDKENIKSAKEFSFDGELVDYDDCSNYNHLDEKLLSIKARMLDSDPVCIFYTSGSTGIPKGVVVSHRGIIDYIEALCEVIGYNDDCIFANQTPLYWDASMKEIYATLKYGATTWIVPKELFMFPVKLVEYLNKHKINTINWVVSALTMISSFGTFDIVKPEYLRTVTFCGEVFPVKQFNIWKSELLNVDFYNLYGPTEATGVSTYYHAERLFDENEAIPIGVPFKGTDIMLLPLDRNDITNISEVNDGEVGEICIRGSGVALGYYGMPDKTAEYFVQNPLNPNYRDLMYLSGDLAYRDSKGNLIFVSRKDHQIKHMGHRIELGEIEANVDTVSGITASCSIYSKRKNKIVLYYVGDIKKSELTKELKSRLPRYMLPNAIRKLDNMPLTDNGKKDRVKLNEMYEESINRKE